MKQSVLLILPPEGGSLIVGRHVAEALADMAHVDLHVLATQELLNAFEKASLHCKSRKERLQMIVDQINFAVLREVERLKPDLVMVMALSPMTPWFVEEVKKLGPVTAHWYVENFRYYPANPIVPSWEIIASSYDFFFTIQKGEFHTRLKEQGVRQCHYLPTGCSRRHHRKLDGSLSVNRDTISEICFVGSPYPNRVKVFQCLKEFQLALWGPGWRDEPALRRAARGNGHLLNSDEEALVINSAKIGLNMHSNLNSDAMIHESDFLNPRVFTIAGCGTFQICDDQEFIGDVFESGREIVLYRDVASLLSQLKRFLSDEEERKNIAARAMNRALAEHTYEHRMARMFEIVGLG